MSDLLYGCDEGVLVEARHHIILLIIQGYRHTFIRGRLKYPSVTISTEQRRPSVYGAVSSTRLGSVVGGTCMSCRK